MKLTRTSLAFGILFSILSILCSCSPQTNADHTQVPLKQESKISTKTELDPGAGVIFRDQQDNLWLASREQGVYRYDGEKLRLFTAEDGLKSYRIIRVQEDQLGNLYFDTPEGVHKLEGERLSVLPVVDAKESPNEWKSEPGNLWFSSGWHHSGPFRYDGENLYSLQFPKNRMENEFYSQYPHASFNPYGIYEIFKDSKGSIWFGTSSLGIYLFDGQDLSWMYEAQLTETPGGGAFGIRSIAEDKAGNYWICNAKYKYSLSPNTSKGDGLQPLSYTRQIGIENIEEEDLYFLSMETDRDGNVYMFANEAGLWLNNGEELSRFFIKDADRNISPTSMYQDHTGTFWFGTEQDGIYHFDGYTFEKFSIE